MNFFSLRFGVVLLIVLIIFTLLCSLGFWQLDRAQMKEKMLLQMRTASQSAILNNQSLLNVSEPLTQRYQKVEVSGLVLSNKTILLDNQIYNKQVGYHVMVPVMLNQSTGILVDRGWVPATLRRKDLPQIPTLDQQINIEGYLDFAYRNRLIKDSGLEVISWPLRVQQIDLQALGALLGIKLYPLIVVLDKNSPGVLTVHNKKVNKMSASRHIGYAVQWFGLASALILWVAYFIYKSNKSYDKQSHA